MADVFDKVLSRSGVFQRGDETFERIRARRWTKAYAPGIERDAMISKAYRKRARTPTDGAWLASGERVYFPDVRIERVRADYEFRPMRGHPHTLLVYSTRLHRYLGYILAETLGYKDVREWIAATGWTP